MKKIAFLFLLALSLQAQSVSFMQEADDRTKLIFGEIIELPFLLELANGTLPKTAFDRYALQDNNYSWDFSRPLSILASNTSNYAERFFFLQAALNSTQEWSGKFPEKLKPCFSCKEYAEFELASVKKSYHQGVAAIAPCFVFYSRVGKWLFKNSVPNNPYQDFINQYADPDFEKQVLFLEEILNRVANEVTPAEREEMLIAYVQSAYYEKRFYSEASQ